MARLTVPVMTLQSKIQRRLSKTVKSGSCGVMTKHDQDERTAVRQDDKDVI
jgi:hypothetical protein